MTVTLATGAGPDLPVGEWVDVCGLAELTPDRGACAYVGGHQVALFLLGGDSEVLALSNFDPYCGAPVLARGIVGSRGDTPVVWSPMYKNGFELRTGRALEDPEVVVPAFPVRVHSGRVLVGLS